MSDDALTSLIAEIRACRVCAEHLSLGPRPIIRAQSSARLLIIGQAPGTRVHASGVPWDDASGQRLRSWLALDPDIFYDARQVAIMPMGMCFPGTGESGDLPPRPECAPLWHARVRGLLPEVRLTLLVGSYALAHYLPNKPKRTLTEQVRNYHRASADGMFPLPHPSWRSQIWEKRNPWFVTEVLPVLRTHVQAALA